MAIKDVLPKLRRERGLTQEDLARKLFITRQAVSRWETGETTPGIDMTKLIAVTLDVPITQLLEMPDHYCQSCGMMFTEPNRTRGRRHRKPRFLSLVLRKRSLDLRDNNGRNDRGVRSPHGRGHGLERR